MAVIWGLDMKEIQWSKFKSSNMWNNRYHLRRTKFIVYQMAMIFCVVSESLGTAALSDYLDQQDYIAAKNPRALEHNNSFVGAFSYNIFVGVYVATIFGAAFFFDLFWPEREESPAVKYAWRVCSVLTSLFVLSSALLLTVIYSRHSAYVSGVDPSEVPGLLEGSKPGSPLVYKENKRALASVIFIWLGLPSTIASTILLWYSYGYNERHNTALATHLRHDGSAETEPKELVPESTTLSHDHVGSRATTASETV